MLILVLIAALSAAVIGYVAVQILMRRSSVERTIADLDRAGIDADRKDELSVFAKMFDERGRTKLERRMIQAGWYGITATRFARRCALAGAGGAAVGILLMVMLHRFAPIMVALVIMLGICGAMLPNALLNNAIKERKRRIRNTLPDFLDMVSTTVEAGIALNGAIAQATEGVTGPLRDELLAVLSDIRVGRSRAESLAALSARVDVPEVTTTVTAIVQAEKLGGDIANILEQLAHDARDHRMTRAEEIAAQLPVKMTFPMALCMLPALFVMIFGAVLADLVSK